MTGRGISRWRTILLGCLLAALPWLDSFPATFDVNSTADEVDILPGDNTCATAGGDCTLRAAIQESNAGNGGDVINLPPGLYRLTIGGSGEDGAATGDLDITDTSGFLTVYGSGGTATVIDANFLDRAFDVLPGVSVDFWDLTIQGGRAPGNEEGGGIRLADRFMNLRRVIVRDNDARSGGGISSGAGTTLYLDRCAIVDNTASSSGGGIHTSNGISITNSTISSNSANSGGGLRCVGAPCSLQHVTITANDAVGGGGINSAPGVTTSLVNSIIALNNSGQDCTGLTNSQGSNIDGDGSCGLGAAGDQPGINPMLGPLQNNGGGTLTHDLLPGSPAIDQARWASCLSPDQRSVGRPVDGDGDSSADCDIGAVEFNGPISGADLSLTKMVDNATPNIGSDITFTLTLSNAGPDDATVVVVEDLLPAGYTYVGSSGSGSYDEVTGRWDVGSVSAGASITLDITVTVNGTGPYLNEAQVLSVNEPDPDSTPGNGTTNGEDDEASASVTPPMLIAISGGVYEDVNADANLSDRVGRAGIDVRLFLDDGDGQPDGGDTTAGTTTTDGTGAWNFSGLDGSAVYWVIVDASTIPPASGSGLAEQTYGPIGALCTDGGSPENTSTRATAGPCYGGRRGNVSDNATINNFAEHVARMAPAGADIAGIEFGFSFNVVTRTASPAQQGTLSQFIDNANNITGPNAMRFVPAVPTNASGSSGDWWEVAPLSALPPLADGQTTLDGTAYDLNAPTSVLDTNGAIAEVTTGPELVIDAIAGGPGLHAQGNDTVVTRLGVRNANGSTTSGAGVLFDGPGSSDSVVRECTISSNSDSGVRLEMAGSGIQVSDNVVRANGISAGDGVHIRQTSAATITGNVIVDSLGYGIDVRDATSSGNSITGNTILRSGQSLTGPQTAGIGLRDGANQNLIQGNQIAQNVGDGIVVATGTRNTISQNSIYANGELAIDLGPDEDGDGVTLNDVGDGDSGSNELQNFPDLTSAIASGGTTTVTGILDSTPGTSFTLEFFSSPAADPSGNGEGETYVDSLSVNTDAGGSAPFSAVLPVSLPLGSVVTATATDPGNNTSEFSNAVPVTVTLADLSLAKAVDNPTPNVGMNVLFTLTVTNSGPSDATGVEVTDSLPSGYTYVSDDGGGAYVSGTGVWTIGVLANGASAILNITASINSSGVYSNAAEVTAAAEIDPDSTPNNGVATEDDYAEIGTAPIPNADLSLAKTVDNATPDVGSNVVFTLTVSNGGISDATGIEVTDLLPGGYTYVSDDGGGAYVSGTGTWTIGSLSNGSNATLNITATVNPSGGYTNVAEVTAAGEPDLDSVPDNGDPTEDDYAEISTAPVAQADLSLTKAVDNGSPAAGSNVVFTLTATNAGPSDATGIAVTDLLPSGYTYVSDDSGGVYASGTGIWTLGPLANGASDTLNITASVNAAGVYLNTAEVTAAAETDPDSIPNNGITTEDDYAEVSTTPGAVADLSLTKTVDNAAPSVGTNVTFTLTVTNAGPSDATGVAVRDLLPSGYTYVSDDGGGAYINGSGIWTVGALASGASATLNITASVNTTGVYLNTAEVTAATETDPDSTPNNGITTEDDYAEISTTPGTVADLSMTKTVDNAAPNVGSNVVFTLMVSNAGPSDATGVAVTDLLPSGYTYASDDGGGAYVSGTGVWTVGTLANGASATLNITAGVDTTGIYLNTTEVTAATGSDPDSTPNNGVTTEDDYAEQGTVPTPNADLSLTKTVDLPTPAVGTNVVFTLTVSNAGANDSTGIEVTDLLPSGYAYVSDDSGGTYNSGSGVWAVGNVAVSGSSALNITATVNPTGIYNNTAEVTAAGEPDLDSVPNNGVTTEDDYAEASIVPVAQADLSLTMVVDNGTPSVGSSVVFTLTVINAGPSDASGVSVEDLLPAGYTYVSDDGAGAYTSATGVWTIGPLANGATDTLNITASVNPSGPYDNAAQILTANESDPDSNPGNGMANGEDDEAIAGTTPTPVADLSLTKVVDNTAPTVGSNVVFTLTVSSAGPSDATGVAVSDLLPSGYTYVSDDGGGSYVSGTGLWTIGALANGTSNVLNITASVNAAGVYLNTAEISAVTELDPDSAPNNGVTSEDDYAEVSTTPGAVADLSLSKSVDNTAPNVGANVVFTLTIDNAGPNDATGIRIADLLPGGYTYISDDGGGAYNNGTGQWNLAILTNGASSTLNITALVNTTGPYTNVAELMAVNEPDPDSSPGNGTGNGEDDVASQATSPVILNFVALSKGVSKRQITVGGLADYVVTANNVSGGPLSGVSISDLIPAGFKFVTGSARLVRAGADGLLGTADDTIAPLAASGNRPVILGPFDLLDAERVEIRYGIRAGSGVVPGQYVNRATPVQGTVVVGNTASATVEILLDPTFQLSILIGKVFEDHNEDGYQDPDDTGVAGAMVALDDGTYALTDQHGRYHFPAVVPGRRMVKLNLHSLPPGTKLTTDTSRIIWLTPGLMAKANFGVSLTMQTESIGRPALPGVIVTSESRQPPIEIIGSAEALTAVVDGYTLQFPYTDVQLVVEALDDIIVLNGSDLETTVVFENVLDQGDDARSWHLSVVDSEGGTFHTFSGENAPPETIDWNGRSEAGELLQPGGIYQYQLEVLFSDGSQATSARRSFGVNRKHVISLRLTGDAFVSGGSTLSSRARKALDEVSQVLLEVPDERVAIEGHTDSTGTRQFNLSLSRRRAEAAATYLIDQFGIDQDRILTTWYGEDRPLASNDHPVGRELNRRVEVRAQVERVTRAMLSDHYRAKPQVEVNDVPVEVQQDGRFRTLVPADETGEVTISMNDSEGRSVSATVVLPQIEITSPQGTQVLAFGTSDKVCRVGRPLATGEWDPGQPAAVCRLKGKTSPDYRLELNGVPLELDGDGGFAFDISLAPGENVFGILVQAPGGATRLARLEVDLSDRDEEGLVVIASEAIPQLAVDLPPSDVKITAKRLQITGRTDPGNRVDINGEAVNVGPSGGFKTMTELPEGPSTLIVRATDPEGRAGQIERDLEVDSTQLFLLAFADGTFGKLDGNGLVQTVGLEDEDEYYSEGRLALYLKGVIAGEYLITAAFDSDQGQIDSIFGELDVDDTRRLLTNLDSERFYPIYGDDSTVVFDVQSQGKFYLALEGEQLQALYGNYPLSLNDTELSAYQRTLHGGRLVYRSLSRTRYGEPNTQVVVFAAEVRQTHVRDELRATGGSLYYLSQRYLVEGSEEITIVVRDMDTGLVLSRVRQRQNIDYTIKYEEGRVMFNRPVASVTESGALINRQLQAGHPVFIQIDYDRIVDTFEKTAAGGRVRQQVGDHVAVGATYVDDDIGPGPYELQGVDAELRIGENSRIVAEYAESEGVDSRLFVSEDGGVSYTGISASGMEKGTAWKAAAELDIGEWFDRPDRYRLSGYVKEVEPGFFSNGNLLEQGTDRMGVHLSLKLSAFDLVSMRHDREERTGAVAPGLSTESEITSLQWKRDKKRWGFGIELQDRSTIDNNGIALLDTQLGSASIWSQLSEHLKGRLERQQTIEGPANNQTTLDFEYQPWRYLGFTVRGTDGSLGSSAQVGAIVKTAKSEIYINERIVDDRAGERSSTVIGARSPLGKASKVYSEYQWVDAEDGQRTISLLGIQRQWDIGTGVKVLLSGETADVIGPSTVSKRSSTTAGLTYSNGSGLTALTRNQFRRENGTARLEQFLTNNQLDYKVHPDVTVRGVWRYSKTIDRDTGQVDARLDDRSLVFAYRPVHHDRFNALARYALILDLRPASLGQLESPERSFELYTIETIYDLTRRMQWLAKLAYRTQEDRIEGVAPMKSESYLTVQRLNLRLWRPIEWGIEYRVLGELEGDDRSQGWLTELMWNVHENVRVGGGYNFTDFTDDEYATNDYSVRGWFFRIQGRY